MKPGQRVRWITGNVLATVLRVTDYGDVIVKPDGALVPITTRPCFLAAP